MPIRKNARPPSTAVNGALLQLLQEFTYACDRAGLKGGEEGDGGEV
jgi:hypothetical protein